ncbi:MAG TPA: Gfo/Idh/MocA family oxidoreductase [Pyrinomonadaceae bacterium]
MNRKVSWGILSTAAIGIDKVIPAMQRGKWSEISAIASRDLDKARQVAQRLRIPRAYGSYEELLADDKIEAIYNPLPNHLHVPWTIRAAEAGKHVLCEKPIGLNLDEARQVLATRDRTGVKIQEAFMVRTHPQWIGTLKLIKSGRIGDLRAIIGSFSYFNRDPANIRNQPEIGGGALMDIGCYPINLSRFLFGAEPRRVLGLIERDPDLGTDRLTSALLDFRAGHSSFTCSTQMVPYQRMQICGTRGRIEVEIPFNAPPDRPTRIFIHDGSDLAGNNPDVMEFTACDQYTIQGDMFSRAILDNSAQAIPLEDAIGNMKVIDALFRSAAAADWEVI